MPLALLLLGVRLLENLKRRRKMVFVYCEMTHAVLTLTKSLLYL